MPVPDFKPRVEGCTSLLSACHPLLASDDADPLPFVCQLHTAIAIHLQACLFVRCMNAQVYIVIICHYRNPVIEAGSQIQAGSLTKAGGFNSVAVE